MDGVLADFDSSTMSLLRRHDPTIVIDRRSFYYHHDYPELKELFSSFHTALGFFRDLPPVDGAVEGWQQLIDLGYEPRVCSSPLTAHPDCINEKKQWLDHHLGPKAVDTAIFTSEKFRAHGIALIDDKPGVTGAEQADWRHIVFNQPYNQTIETDLRLHGWHDPRLAALLTTCRDLALSSRSVR